MPKPYAKAREAIETAVELSDRFPDLLDNDVLDHVEFVTGLELDERDCMTRAVLSAYNDQSEKAGYDTFAAIVGIDIRP